MICSSTASRRAPTLRGARWHLGRGKGNERESEVVTRLRRGGVSILDAVFTELPDVFYGEILPKLDLLDTQNLAQVSKSYNDAVWSVEVRSLEPKIKAHVEMLEDEARTVPPH